MVQDFERNRKLYSLPLVAMRWPTIQCALKIKMRKHSNGIGNTQCSSENKQESFASFNKSMFVSVRNGSSGVLTPRTLTLA